MPAQRSATGGYLDRPSGYNKEYGDKEVGGSGATSEDAFARVPTLHNKRDAEHLMPRKKSSKRRKNDHDREAEIKAMSKSVPVRPATDDWTHGRPMKKETRKVRTGLGLGFRGATRQEWDKENRSSDISLPLAGSIHSGMSSDSEHVSWKVSAMDALAPRPTLRYTVYPRQSAQSSESNAQGPTRISSQRRKLSEREPFPESTIKAHKRIDDLADDLDASDLRELMERDKRRRERKRQSDQEKIARRLARRAEKQKAEEAGVSGEQQPQNLERGVLGREAVGYGAHPASAVVTSSRRRPSSERTPPRSREKPQDETTDVVMGTDSPAHPLDEFHRTTSMQLDIPMSPEETDELHEAPAPVLLRSSKQYGALRSKNSRSKSPLTSDEKVETLQTRRKDSESSVKGPLAWMSMFKWTNRNSRRDSGGPSSFSNTSRETMQTTQLPTPPVSYIAQSKLASGIPRRTMSRFREDLPETALPSPPISRVQSPADEVMPTTIMETSPDAGKHNSEIQPTPPPLSFEMRDDPAELMRETPSTFSRLDEAQPSPEPQAISLASFDSEASWLSGRLGGVGRRRRSSAARTQHPYTQSQQTPSPKADQETPGEDVSIVNDEYLSRYTPSQEPLAWHRRSTGEGRPSSDGEGEEARWGSVRGHVPTVVQPHAVDRMKSREGLLNTFGEEPEVVAGSDDGDASFGEASPSPVESAIEVQRAKSINFGKGHVRNFSAGSARLLDLTPRTSVDGKRRSVEPRL